MWEGLQVIMEVWCARKLTENQEIILKIAKVRNRSIKY